MSRMNVLGLDPSLRNWGVAAGEYEPDSGMLRMDYVDLIRPAVPTGKSIRQNSKDLEAAATFYQHALMYAKGFMASTGGVHAVFVEVPVGSQSARAMASYGLCVGVLGSLRAAGVPFFEVTPLEVKMATVGKKTASKAEMIEWATRKFPDANWPTETKKGQLRIVEGKAEHMADAMGAVMAGIRTPPFQQLVSMLRRQPA